MSSGRSMASCSKVPLMSKKVLPWWSGATTTKPWLARCSAWKVFWKRMPFELCENVMSGKGASSASATSRADSAAGYQTSVSSVRPRAASRSSTRVTPTQVPRLQGGQATALTGSRTAAAMSRSSASVSSQPMQASVIETP